MDGSSDSRNNSSKSLSGDNQSRNSSPSRPLLKIRIDNAPSANLENEAVTKPHPGVDNGFLNTNEDSNIKPTEKSKEDPDMELVPTRPKDPESVDEVDHNKPAGASRFSGDGDNGHLNPPPANVPSNPKFPNSPGFRPWGFDFEVGSTLPSGETIPDLNVYQHKKTLAQGMMDLALFSANANQLRYIMETFRSHPYFYPSVVLISVSLILQVAVGIGLIWNATYNVKNKQALCVANRINNMTTIFVFLITVINVFISAFGVAPAPS